MMLAFAMVSALLAVRNGAPGQVIDCAMTDGSALLASLTWGLHAAGLWEDEPAPTASTAARLITTPTRPPTANGSRSARSSRNSTRCCCEKLGIAATPQDDPRACKRRLAALFRTRIRDEWCALLEGIGRLLRARSCRSPRRPAIRTTRRAAPSSTVGGVTQPAPAPRYSQTATDAPRRRAPTRDALLAELGYDAGADRGALREAGIIG